MEEFPVTRTSSGSIYFGTDGKSFSWEWSVSILSGISRLFILTLRRRWIGYFRIVMVHTWDRSCLTTLRLTRLHSVRLHHHVGLLHRRIHNSSSGLLCNNKLLSCRYRLNLSWNYQRSCRDYLKRIECAFVFFKLVGKKFIIMLRCCFRAFFVFACILRSSDWDWDIGLRLR